jgi:succinate dehydrogenase / fumarate reductase cytochrome b subunit
MTPAQTAFLGALAVIVLLVAGFGLLVVAQARRSVSAGPARFYARLATPATARLELHRWAYYAHRVSGLGIFAFLGLHLVDVGLVAISPQLYDEVHTLYGTPLLRVFEVALLAAILFHALDGLRLLLLDVVDLNARVSELLLWVAVAVTVGLTIPAAIVILGPVIR